jgi:hypothetical protein
VVSFSPLFTALYKVNVCNGVTATPYPKAIHGSEIAPVTVSLGLWDFRNSFTQNGNPNGLFNPKFSILSTNCCGLFL